MAICKLSAKFVGVGKLLFILRYVFLLFSSDIFESRRHIHVTDTARNNERLCKFWLEPTIELAYNHGFSQKEINEIAKLIQEHKGEIDKQVTLFMSGKSVKAVTIKPKKK